MKEKVLGAWRAIASGLDLAWVRSENESKENIQATI